MRFGKIFFFLSLFLCISFAVVCWVVPFGDIYSIDNEVYCSPAEAGHNFSNLVTTRYNENTQEVDFLLFNTVKIHSVNAEVGKRVYLGGNTLGFSYHGDGVLVIAKNETTSKNDIMTGDIIQSINGQKVNSISDLMSMVNENPEQFFKIKVIRDGQNLEIKVKPKYDAVSGKYKLGLWTKENLSGIGTLTFVDPDTGRFGALGHPILEQNTRSLLGVKEGELHECSILGVKKAIRGIPGELRGVFVRSKVDLGTVDKNTESGIFGDFNMNNEILEGKRLIEVGGRLSAHPGKAQIYSSIDGKNIKAYDIEIIKTNYQSAQSPKNMVFKVTDKRLIDTTGGVVQGMSGSPIVQDGKLIGAVTHVFVNDATKGFAIYIDNMLNN